LLQRLFYVLRHREQLGYIVYSSVSRNNGVQGLTVVVQSERSPDYLEGRVEAFIDHVGVSCFDLKRFAFIFMRKALFSVLCKKLCIHFCATSFAFIFLQQVSSPHGLKEK